MPLLLVALSGGADSTALAAALAAIRERSGPGKGFILRALHVNHGIRSSAECAADAEAAEAFCASIGIPLTVKTIPPGTVKAFARENGTGLEGAARYFRYTALGEEARRTGARAVLTAHTRDDLLETILMAFLRGAGPAGLGALQGRRVSWGGAGFLGAGAPAASSVGVDVPVLRPLLSLGRADVLAYLEARNLAYRTDPSNSDEGFLRNRIRGRLIPLLDECFPGWREPVRRLGETQGMTAAFLADEAALRLPWEEIPGQGGSPMDRGSMSPRRIRRSRAAQASGFSALEVSQKLFFSQPEIIREEALFAALDRFSGSSFPGKNPRREVLRSFILGKTGTCDLGKVRIEGGPFSIRVLPAKTGKAFEQGFSVLIKRAGVYKLKGLTVEALDPGRRGESAPGEFSAEYPLVLRSSGPGEVSPGAIIAEDRRGLAAVLGSAGLIHRRGTADGGDNPDTGAASFTVHSPG
ncbi:MAG: tRNA lysidine(34) synthetase TilS [Treponema sp.]|jgi:tRNA(Ile)-lysidine synthase|nr:tRNA lysidine(34) synthetase TilS [Treponema sp.]